MESVYQLEHVYFSYSEQSVLEDVSFTIMPGDYVGIVGDNGGGKTTLLRLLTGQLEPDRGKILFFGDESFSREKMSRLGFVAQVTPSGSRTTSPISCAEMVALGLGHRLSGRFFLKKEEKKRVAFALDHLDALDLADRNFFELSGGQQQRVLIAKAFAGDPDLLILDEPTVGVDQTNTKKFYEVLDHMNQVHQMTILLVTHGHPQGEPPWKRQLVVEDREVREVC